MSVKESSGSCCCEKSSNCLTIFCTRRSPSSVPFGQQRQVRTADEVIFPVPPRLDLAVDVGKPLLRIQGVDDIVRVLEEVFQILFGFLDLAGPLSYFEFKLFPIVLQLSFEPL